MNNLIPIKGQRKVILGEMTSPVEKGDIIFSTTPIFPTLNSGLLSSHCSGCLKTARQISEDLNIDIDKVEERMLKCSRCQVHVFCSMKCYASTWCSLIDECRGLANNPGWIPNTFARLVAKVLTARRFGRDLYDPLPNYAVADTDCTHINEETLKIHDSVIQLLAQPKCEGETLIYTVQLCQYHIEEEDGFETLVGRILSCLFTLYDTSANPLGIGLSPDLSSIRQSCKPNCQIVFHTGPNVKNGMSLVANKTIYPGEEITISYVDLALPIHLRQAALAKFGFDHSQLCPHCSMTIVDCRWAAKHQKCTMSGIIPLSPSPGSSKAERSITGSAEKRECDRCSENITIDKFKQRYEELMSVVGEIWEKEQKGVLLPYDEEATLGEIQTLSAIIPRFLQTFPGLIYPVPYLQIRYARLLSTLPRTLSNTKEIIENYTQAYSSFLSLNNDLSTPLTCSLAFELVNSHLDILRIFKQLIEKRSKRKIGYKDLGKSDHLKTSEEENVDDGEIESYLKEGQDWIESCKDHLNDLAYTQHNHGHGLETKFRELELERWQRQYEELDIWFNYIY